MSKSLVIVESPTKAKTITRFLDKKKFIVKSSYGHIRDLPKSKLGVDVEKDFEPTYVIPQKAKKPLAELKKAAEKVDDVILATDEDREGEAIAWHLTEALKVDAKKAKRIVFHEITESAIKEALEKPRTLDMSTVDAQQARRILDRLVGYNLSPFLWHKIRYGLSAGRVQSVAVRLIVEREREIQAFKPQEYWSIVVELQKRDGKKELFEAKLAKKDGTRLDKFAIENEEQAQTILKELTEATYKVESVTQKERKRTPPAPFTTSTLQQEASRKLGFSAKQTMMIAQQLYEGIEVGGESTGLITYMRTDSKNLSKQALEEAQVVIKDHYGEEYGLTEPRVFTKKSKGAQEAHEAIRPTKLDRLPGSLQPFLDARQFKLYELIWKRTLACQMEQATLNATSVDIDAGNGAYTFRATGQTVQFDGYLAVYFESTEEDDLHEGTAKKNGDSPLTETILPELTESEELDEREIKSNQHFTEPPPRYSEASLVKTLEEYGIGRPSTYAPTISTIVARGYVKKEQRRLYPEDIGFTVNDLLVEHFPDIVDYEFTAGMEAQLDAIAEGEVEWKPFLKDFFNPLVDRIAEKEKSVDKVVEETDEICPECKQPIIIKYGRFGRFKACTGYPDCKYTEPMDEEKKLREEYKGEICDECGKPMEVKQGRFGIFLGCTGYPDCTGTKKVEKRMGVTCPKCNEGDIVEKKTKKGGRVFYSCSRYPDCEHSYWQKPTGKVCPQCEKEILVLNKDKRAECADKECGYEEEVNELGDE
ncbi:MAG: type I DNA topoisomerase [Candidatus Doudnabacteria bacterium]|nr:type I DNA topoisomerase [Candidatus Doudnabacteria bacterium]